MPCSDLSTLKRKEPQLKNLIKSNRLASPALQVTISEQKEKHSIHSKKDKKGSTESVQGQQSKRIKLNTSKTVNVQDSTSL